MTTPFNPDISVLVADDDIAIAQAFVAYLKQSFGTVRCVTTLPALPAALREHAPNVVVLDLRFGKHSSLRILPKLCRDYPAIRFVTFTAYCEAPLVETALRAGALGYASKTADAEELYRAITEALAGRTFVSGEVYAHDATGIKNRAMLIRWAEQFIVRPATRTK